MTDRTPITAAELSRPHLGSDIAVRVFGTDDTGRPFSLNATARNLRLKSALISGLQCSLRTGDIIGVQFENRKARFRVAMILSEKEFEVEIGDGQESPWTSPEAERKIDLYRAWPFARFRRRSLARPLKPSLEANWGRM